MSNLPLQDMIANTIKTARAKMANEEKKVTNLLAYEKKEHGHIPTPKEEEEEEKHDKTASSKLVDSEHVEKLASLVEYLAGHLDEVTPPGPIASAIQKLAMKPGAGGGSAGGKSVPSPVSSAGALETTEAIGGKQKYTKNKAKGEQAEDEHGKPLSNARPHDGKTQLDNNMHEAPGNNSGAVPRTEYPKKGPLVAGPSGSHNKGPNSATEKAANAVTQFGGLANKAKELGATAFARHPGATMAALGAGVGGASGAAGGALSAQPGHRMSGAAKGGLAGAGVGGAATAAMAHKTGIKMASPQELARQHILMKLAGEDVMKAHIDGGGTVSPLAGKGQLKSMKAGEESPMQGGMAANSQDGNSGVSLVASNQAAIDYTKRDAKKKVVAPLKEVLDQPAFSQKHDNKLEENLRNTGKAGVKIAGVRTQLEKIASGGCTCNSKSECQFCHMSEKLAEMGGMSPMSEAGAGHDGCTCGHTGECRVCKLSAAMSAAKGGHGADAGSAGSV